LERPFWFDHRSDLSPGVVINPIDPKALFRLSVLGPLISREQLERGELQIAQLLPGDDGSMHGYC